MARKKVCADAGCVELVAGGEPHCPQHRRIPWQGNASGRKRTTAYERFRKAVLQRDNYRCVLCGARANQVDHIVPAYRGGQDTLDNAQSLCVRCHLSKSSREGHEARWGK